MRYLALFIAIYLPITANLTQQGFYCYSESVTAGTWTEHCTEVREDGSKRTCETRYVEWEKVGEECEG